MPFVCFVFILYLFEFQVNLATYQKLIFISPNFHFNSDHQNQMAIKVAKPYYLKPYSL